MAIDTSGKFTILTKLFYDVENEPSLNRKTELIHDYLHNEECDKYLAVKLLLCKEDLRVYNLNNKSLVKVAAAAFEEDYDDLRDHLDEGDVSMTLSYFIRESENAAMYSTVTLKQIDDFLESLTTKTRTTDQVDAFSDFCCSRLTDIDMLWLTRLIRKDLRIGSGSRVILDAVHEQAYDSWKRSSNLEYVVKQAFGISLPNANNMEPEAPQSTLEILGKYDLSDSDGDDDDRRGDEMCDKNEDAESIASDATEDVNFEEDSTVTNQPSTSILSSTAITSTSSNSEEAEGDKKRKRGEDSMNAAKSKVKKLNLSIQLGIPVRPQLAKAVKTFDEVLQKCPNGFYADLKIDGERIQIHKDEGSFQYWSRNLKLVSDYKIEGVKEFIEKAIDARKIILDGEITMISTKTGEALPFGALGKHKRKAYGDEEECVVGIYLFDILFLEGKSLLDYPYRKRRRLLKRLIKPVQHRVMIAKTQLIDGSMEEREALLAERMSYMISQNYEGLVIKDVESLYEPKARKWLKMKKMNIQGMADTIDACVVGGYYGTGRLAGKIAVYLMAVRDVNGKMWTVCKVGNGHDDDTIETLTNYFSTRMTKIQGDHNAVPNWLNCNNIHTPDLVLNNPEETLVFEIAGAEFTDSIYHPLGISVRFPYVVKIRDDKDIKTATSVVDLKHISQESKRKNPVTIGRGTKNLSTTSNTTSVSSASTTSNTTSVSSASTTSTTISNSRTQSTTRNTSNRSRRTTAQEEEEDDDEYVDSQYIWQYYDNGFHDYDEIGSGCVEKVYQEWVRNPGNFDVRSVSSGNWNYMIDFRNMTQTNVNHPNHTVRRIRRHKRR